MEIVKLGKKGQLNIPRRLMEVLGLKGDSLLIVDTTEDGAIVLRPAAVAPIEMYSDERIQMFLEAAAVSDDLDERIRAKLAHLEASANS